MIIKKWNDNFDLWSYVHWIGTAYLASTVGILMAICFAVGWELLDWIWSWDFFRYRKIVNKSWFKIAKLINRVFDNRGASYGDLLMDGLGVFTWYAHTHVGWVLALGIAAVVFAIVEMSRKE